MRMSHDDDDDDEGNRKIFYRFSIKFSLSFFTSSSFFPLWLLFKEYSIEMKEASWKNIGNSWNQISSMNKKKKFEYFWKGKDSIYFWSLILLWKNIFLLLFLMKVIEEMESIRRGLKWKIFEVIEKFYFFWCENNF